MQQFSLYVVNPVVVSRMYWTYRCIELPYQLLPLWTETQIQILVREEGDRGTEFS